MAFSAAAASASVLPTIHVNSEPVLPMVSSPSSTRINRSIAAKDRCNAARDRWTVLAHELKKPKMDPDTVFRALQFLDIELESLRDDQSRVRPTNSMKQWYIETAIKVGILFLIALSTITGSAVTAADAFVTNNQDCKRPIATLVLFLVSAILSSLATIAQTVLSIKELHDRKRDDALIEKNNLIEDLLNSFNRDLKLLILRKGDNELVMELIKKMIKTLRQLPPDYIDEHEGITAIISNLISLTPEYSQLREHLKSLHPAERGSTLLAHGRADQSQTLEMANNYENDDLDRKSSQDLWKNLEAALDCIIPQLFVDGRVVLRPRGLRTPDGGILIELP